MGGAWRVRGSEGGAPGGVVGQVEAESFLYIFIQKIVAKS